MNDDLLNSITREIEALHRIFVAWFTGAMNESDFERDFLARFDPDCPLIPSAGVRLPLEQLANSVRRAYASNPDFVIAIRNVRVRRELPGHALATYEEWQRNALASTPPDNARAVTALFRLDTPLRWLHIHETWLPRSHTPADRFDF